MDKDKDPDKNLDKLVSIEVRIQQQQKIYNIINITYVLLD